MSRDHIIAARTGRRWNDALVALGAVYGDRTQAIATRALALAEASARARSDALFALDEKRDAHPDWFLASNTVGYVCYVDRFARSLRGLETKLDYLAELGITYLHLMPLLQPREGENDGGYAVASYDEVDDRLGTMADLETLADSLRSRGISLCIDLVINHTASEHEWAVKAADGDPTYRAYYRIFPDRTEPDRYEQTLREVFPDFAPGNFSPLGDEWVWTTFHEYQWDLNYENPDVFCEMLAVMCRLANRGVDVFRLDAVPFLWKRLGTDCENQPEAHALLRALRAFVSIAAPAVVFKAEAIVPPEQLVPYLGAGDPPTHECQIAYNNQLMVLLWSCLATRDGALATAALSRMVEAPAGTTWVTYVRCHDDIGWAVDDHDARSVGWSGGPHRAFLSQFYSGVFPGSFARGALFQHNPVTGDARISGSAASLCGIEAALESGSASDLTSALARLELVYAVVFSYGGIPLVYMGDELALRNDHQYLNDAALADDNRWMHRPVFHSSVADRRHQGGTIEARAFRQIAELARERAALSVLAGDVPVRVEQVADRRLFSFTRRNMHAAFTMIANFSDDFVAATGQGRAIRLANGAAIGESGVMLPPLSYIWLLDDTTP